MNLIKNPFHVLLTFVGILLFSSCATRKHATFSINPKAKIQPAYVFKDGWVIVRGEKWREKARLGWVDVSYESPNTSNYINVTRFISDGKQIAHRLSNQQMVTLRKRQFSTWSTDVKMRFERMLNTKFGTVAIYFLTEGDLPVHQIALYQAQNGTVTEIEFFNRDTHTPHWDIGPTLDGMFDAGLLSPEFQGKVD